MAESVADDPKLAPLWDAGQNPKLASKVEARSFRPGSVAVRERTHIPDIVVDIVRDGQHELHAFDAKLRIDGVVPSAGEHSHLRECRLLGDARAPRPPHVTRSRV